MVRENDPSRFSADISGAQSGCHCRPKQSAEVKLTVKERLKPEQKAQSGTEGLKLFETVLRSSSN